MVCLEGSSLSLSQISSALGCQGREVHQRPRWNGNVSHNPGQCPFCNIIKANKKLASLPAPLVTTSYLRQEISRSDQGQAPALLPWHWFRREICRISILLNQCCLRVCSGVGGCQRTPEASWRSCTRPRAGEQKARKVNPSQQGLCLSGKECYVTSSRCSQDWSSPSPGEWEKCTLRGFPFHLRSVKCDIFRPGTQIWCWLGFSFVLTVWPGVSFYMLFALSFLIYRIGIMAPYPVCYKSKDEAGPELMTTSGTCECQKYIQ